MVGDNSSGSFDCAPITFERRQPRCGASLRMTQARGMEEQQGKEQENLIGTASPTFACKRQFLNPSNQNSRISHWSSDYVVLILLTSVISVSALLFYYHRDAILLYGDAVAHINIARRVFDSRTPGLFQLGTVWLPLPHLLDIPFIMNDWLWQTGLGASIPSMLAYVMGPLGVYRLVRGLASRWAAWIAALIFSLNPNLIYMQATAMTEALYLALFVWAVVFFSE